MPFETAFTMDTSSIKFGPGVTREIGQDMSALGARRVMVVTDSHLSSSQPVATALAALRLEGIDVALYDQAHVEPTDVSFNEAIRFAQDGAFDGYVGVGGGSAIDTAKVANLYATHPADLLTYVNAPIGQGQPVPGPLKPMLAVPTTAGTGSETTGVAIFDYLEMRAKTGIAHRTLRPTMGIVDPNNTRTMPRLVAASSGMDVLSHALESLTALPYNRRSAPDRPGLRPSYQGANPISRIWASRAIEIVSRDLLRFLADPDDDEARANMSLAASFAGIGFGNAGVTLPHGMSYPVSGMVKSYTPEGYPADEPLIPHGMAVILNAPAVFRFTAPSNPELHLYAASLMGADTTGAAPSDAGEILSCAVIELMRASGMPNGLSAVGYEPDDVDALVQGTLPQHRVTKLSPRPFDADELRQLFLDSMVLW